MATDAPEEPQVDQEAQAPVEAPAQVNFWVKLGAVGGLLGVIIIIQTGLLFYFMSGSDPADSDELKDPNALSTEALSSDFSKEVEIIPPFNCTNSLAEQGHAIHVTFSLIVTVPQQRFDQFNLAKKDHKYRIRQSVITVIRNASLEDLNDPNLSMIKRQIQEEINKILNQSYVNDVIITDFRKMEQ